MRIQHNIMAMSAYRNYTNNVSAMKKNLEKLSSGYKINRAGDDAAGLAISEKMRAQITGLETAQKNAKDGISLVQTAEGALTEVHDMLNRMVELATQSANGTYDNTTDRAQMQKEVNQLLDEIDRIADSSNFNGINLLDGTLGLNTDAFQVVAGDAYQEAVAASAIVPTTSNYHGGSSVTGQPPAFTIDLNDIEISNGGSASSTLQFKISFAGITLSATTTATIAKGAKATGAQIQAAIQNALDAKFSSNASDGSGHNLADFGGVRFKAAVTGNSITFTFHTTSATGTAAETWNDKVTGSAGKTLAAAVNTAITGGVKFEAVGSNTKLTGGKTEIHADTAVKDAVANEPAQRPGIDIDIADLVKDGYKLTIASGTGANAGKTTYVFKTDKDSTVTANGANEILVDVSKIAASQQAEKAAWVIAGGAAQANGKPTGHANGAAQTAAGGMFKVGLKSGTTIHIDVAASTNASKADSEAKMKALITAEKAAQSQKAANTKLVISGPAKEGNVLTIGDDKITLNEGDDAAKVMAAIKGKGYTVTMADGTGDYTGKKVLTIEAKTAAASVSGPAILGKGLTLQIGDTSDDFNQLNVTVNDCHASSLGVGGLDISTEESAQKAIAKIKSAVNFVSDVRGTLGATQNRLDHTINNLSVMTENIQDAESTIRDTDVAEEMMAYTKNNILIQSAQAMLAQANQVPQGVLQLLQ